MIPKIIQEKLIEHKFAVREYEENCTVYTKCFKTLLLGDVDIDVYDKKGFDPVIHIFRDCGIIKKHPIKNIDLCVNEIKKLEAK